MALRYLVDTNRLTDALRGDSEVINFLETAAEVWISFVSLAELRAGFMLGSRKDLNEGLLQAFLRLPGVGVVFADRETTIHYARLFLQLRRAHTPIPTNDLWIASLAVQHNLVLLSRDFHFDRLPQIERR